MGVRVYYDVAYHFFPGSDVVCPSVSSSTASYIVFSSPTTYRFPNSSDVSISYSRTGHSTVTLASSTSAHGLGNFTEGSTTVHVEAMDSAGNSASCQFTYTRKPGRPCLLQTYHLRIFEQILVFLNFVEAL